MYYIVNFLYLCSRKTRKMGMFKKETEYALRGLVYVQNQNLKGRKPGVEEIAREIEAPHYYTAKILQQLVRSGFLGSAKGKGGGFFFEENKPDLPLKDIIVSIEGDKVFIGCGFGMKDCDPENPCPVHEHYAGIRDSINKMVIHETIQSLASKDITDLES